MKDTSDNLAHKKCMACTVGTPKLKGKELEDLYQKLEPGWKVIDEHYLEKEYEFPDFKHALQFVNDLGQIAEEEGHHPDLFLAWGRVKVSLWTHKINGLSESDFIFAAKCDEQYDQYPFGQKF
jgi:4a-hydroxytetrahydrobiopterin dehydratase